MNNKRADVLALAQTGAYAMRIIKRATEPDADADYVRRLRLWATDCAARAVLLIVEHKDAFSDAVAAIEAARAYARGKIEAAGLSPFRCNAACKFCIDCERTAFSVKAEVSLCAALTAQEDVWFGARRAAEHARQAVINATMRRHRRALDPTRNAYEDELHWQTERLVLWLDPTEPKEWPIRIASSL